MTLAADTKVIADGACRGMKKLTELSLPEGLLIIGGNAFAYCSGIERVIIPDSVRSIGAYAFAATGLTEITVPDSVTYFEGDVFNSCASLTKATLGAGITSLGWNVFNSYSSLQIVTFIAPVSFIGHRAFYNCPSLKTIYYSGTEEQWNNVYMEVSAYGTGYNGAVEDAEVICNWVPAPHSHSWGKVTYNWSEDNAVCTARRVCTEC